MFRYHMDIAHTADRTLRRTHRWIAMHKSEVSPTLGTMTVLARRRQHLIHHRRSPSQNSPRLLSDRRDSARIKPSFTGLLAPAFSSDADPGTREGPDSPKPQSSGATIFPPPVSPHDVDGWA